MTPPSWLPVWRWYACDRCAFEFEDSGDLTLACDSHAGCGGRWRQITRLRVVR